MSRLQPAQVRIDARFCGPPGLGNGGFSCGTFAASVGSPATVTLRRPVPLEQPLAILPAWEGEGVIVEDGAGELVAEVEPAPPLAGLEPPRRPSPAEAERASRSSPFRTDRHAYPGCFVCGPEHPDGLQVQVGELEGEPALAAAAFTIPAELAEDGVARPEVVWATLDCPSYVPTFWAGPRVLLGRLTAELIEPVPAEQPLVAVSWPLAEEGRKLHSASAVLDAAGKMLARARALWIRLRPDS